ncbi:hypothetical protein HN695_00310 [Candidatus Woesearchaeota archaeon]|mgnify:FL=1|jgi:hypothetical protein|nr:hypothetical protein [Candidatus Woesearchaeota archaeon]MBT5271999.1 hypothetical protein [Candidatus Woesearchaeota archaeon]MBT6041072.1 hypothetical protein [Candidatus Woesearchaeota archaeon]MBT6337090.1 hypothetical protein [Candidatus Woesearchaeota archaeon]MBT7926755.1 hypothetical protein [Candidatus Woesearchaeota archaeon]
MSKKLIVYFLFVLVLTFSAFAVKISENNPVNDLNHEILLVGVTEDNACIFKIDGTTIVIDEHEDGKYNGVYIWVKDAVQTHSQGDNYCEVIVSYLADLKNKETSSEKGLEIKEEKEIGEKEKIEEEIPSEKEASAIVDEFIEESLEEPSAVDEETEIGEKEIIEENEIEKTLDEKEHSPVVDEPIEEITSKSLFFRIIQWFKSLFS